MNSNDDIASADRYSSNRAYNAARAEWHSYRASVAGDTSTKILHEKFASLYRARSEADDAHPATAAEL